LVLLPLLGVLVEVKIIPAAAMMRDKVVDDPVDVRQFGTLADLKTRYGDVTNRLAIYLNRSIRPATTDGKLLC
jgi:hypothetical protein